MKHFCKFCKGTTLKILLAFAVLACVRPRVFAQDLSNIQNAKPVTIGGAFQATGIGYGAEGIADRRQPFNYLLNGDLFFNFYGVVVPVGFSYTKSQSTFVQPFNQFGISPTYKWVTLHAGYRNVEFSPYTLAGHTLYGLGAELHPGKLRLGFMYGRLNKATTVDTTSGALVPYSFSRKAYAAKLGYGTEANFFELSYLQAKDDSTSVSRNGVPVTSYVTPAANTVAGYETRFTFFKHLFFESAGALSLYTRDLNSPIKVDTSKNSLLKQLKSFADINGTSQYFTALNAAMGYRDKYVGLKVVYKRIDPEYQSMGAYYFDTDLESWSIAPSFNFFKNKVRLAGNLGFQHDNLLHQKRSTNKRVIGAGNMNIEFSRSFAIDANYSNFSNDQKPNTVKYPDSLRIVQTTSNISFTPRYTIITADHVHVISITAAMSKLNDLNKIITSQLTTNRNVDTKQYFITYALTFTKKSLGLVFNVNRTDLTSPEAKYTYQGVTVGTFGSFFKTKLQANVNVSAMQGITNQGKSLIINGSGGLTYRVNRLNSLKYAAFYTGNNPAPGSTQKSTSEYRNELSYLLNF